MHRGALAARVEVQNVRPGKLRTDGQQTERLVAWVPTLRESALPGFEFDAYIAIVGPTRIPAWVAAATNNKIKAALNKEVCDALLAQDLTVAVSMREQFAPLLKSERPEPRQARQALRRDGCLLPSTLVVDAAAGHS